MQVTITTLRRRWAKRLITGLQRMAARVAIRFNPIIRRHYQNLLAAGKRKKSP